MQARLFRVITVAVAFFGCVAVAAVAVAFDPANDLRGQPYVRRVGRSFQLSGRPFRPVGASNYYLMYKSPAMVDSLLNTAATSGFNTVRMQGTIVIGNQDGSNSIHGKADGVYFQYWDGTRPAFNDGADGLRHLDYVVYKAGQLGLKLIIPLVNNWNDFGGMDQYVRWRGGKYHDDFYTDSQIRRWYKDWLSHLLNRVNTYTGIPYKDDATIMTWELANEPRCRSGSSSAYPRSPSCTSRTLIDWADDVSAYLKSIDSQHLVSVGDEGFYCIAGATDWTEDCSEGVDTLALADLPYVDVMSLHMYPDNWEKSVAWGTAWIQRHIRDARSIHERVILGEFGVHDKATRNPIYKEWTDAVLASDGGGALYWMLSDKQDDGTLYPDYDGYTVYCPTPVCTTFSHFAAMMKLQRPIPFPPVADHDTETVEFNTSATLAATANDVSYAPARLLLDSIDLDPATPGQQLEHVSAAGTFKLISAGIVTFTPASMFSGEAVATYVVRAAADRVSNPATLTVVVKPDPKAPIKLFSFETGTEGWAAGSWQMTAGTVAPSSTFATDGTHSLQISTMDGGWFGLNLAAAVDLGSKTHLKLDVKTTAISTSQNVALQVGSSFTWCESGWGFLGAGTTSTVDVDLPKLKRSCGVADLSEVRALYVFFSGGGVFYLDNVRAE